MAGTESHLHIVKNFSIQKLVYFKSSRRNDFFVPFTFDIVMGPCLILWCKHCVFNSLLTNLSICSNFFNQHVKMIQKEIIFRFSTFYRVKDPFLLYDKFSNRRRWCPMNKFSFIMHWARVYGSTIIYTDLKVISLSDKFVTNSMTFC